MGRHQFGRAYEYMLDRDTHAEGSVDQILTQRMVRLCAATAPFLYSKFTPTYVSYVPGSRPELEAALRSVLTRWPTLPLSDPWVRPRVIPAVLRLTCELADRADDVPLDDMRFGGTEEEIIRRGTDWCTDLARVACALFQVAGVPARIVNLFDTERAYSGHVVVEAYCDGSWGAHDPTFGLSYLCADGAPASVWRVMSQPEGVRAVRCADEGDLGDPRHPGVSTLEAPLNWDQFRAAAIVNYQVQDFRTFDYTVSALNEYCRSIVEVSVQGWPGGLRWLHGEDEL